MPKRLLQFLLCVMLLIQLGPVAPCLLDEALNDDGFEAVAKSVSLANAPVHVDTDDDAGNPSLSQVRLCDAQRGVTRSFSHSAVRIDLAAMFVPVALASCVGPHCVIDRLDDRPASNSRSERILPLRI